VIQELLDEEIATELFLRLETVRYVAAIVITLAVQNRAQISQHFGVRRGGVTDRVVRTSEGRPPV
jgi:hypothetical protein